MYAPYREPRDCNSWDEIRKEIPSMYKLITETPGYTTWRYLDHDFDFYKDYAVVMGYSDDNGEDEPVPKIKIGYHWWNTVICEYEMDWLLPYLDEDTGELYDCEFTIPNLEDAFKALDWLQDMWEKTIKPTLRERWEKKPKKAVLNLYGEYIVGNDWTMKDEEWLT